MSLRYLLLLGLLGAGPAYALDGSVDLNYGRNFVPADPFMNIGLGLSHKVTKYFSVRASQNFEKNLFVDADTREVEATDTVLGLTLHMLTPLEALNWKFGAKATLPVSKASQHHDVITRVSGSMGLDYKGPVSFCGSVMAEYQFNKFQSTPTENGEGGIALYHYGYGADLCASATILENLSFSLDGSYREKRYEDIHFEGAGVPLIDYSPEQGYSIGAGFSVELWASASVGLSVSQGRLLQQEGWSDYVVFDKTESTWSINFTQSF